MTKEEYIELRKMISFKGMEMLWYYYNDTCTTDCMNTFEFGNLIRKGERMGANMARAIEIARSYFDEKFQITTLFNKSGDLLKIY